jgi:hypothetical protein
MEPWIHDHIHEKPEEKHRLARALVGAALIWSCVLVTTVGAARGVKKAMKRVKRQAVGYNRSIRKGNTA